jgi:thioredoxin 1
MRIKFAALVLMFLLSLSSCSNAGDIDTALSKAKQEGKIVMLELGSVGCISCEQMKPVIQQLRDAYQGKLDVIFVDVREDHKTGRQFGVHVIPTQVFLDKTGKEFHRHIGFYSYEEIVPIMKKNGL